MTLNLLQRIVLCSSIALTSLLENRVSAIEADLEPNKKYAILLNGDVYKTNLRHIHRRNIVRAYHTLKSFGFHEDNLFIVCKKKDFESVVNNLSKISYSADTLLVYGTGHGGSKHIVNEDKNWMDESYIMMKDNHLSAPEFKGIIEKIDSKVTIVIMDQCYSGGFVDELKSSSRNVIALSDTDAENETYCKYFSRAFWKAFLDPNADLDKSGQISLREAYTRALEVHKENLKNKPERTNGKYFCTEPKYEHINLK